MVRNTTAGAAESGTIWSLQSLRFVAAMMVVYFHAAGASLIATHSYSLLPRDFQIVGRAGGRHLLRAVGRHHRHDGAPADVAGIRVAKIPPHRSHVSARRETFRPRLSWRRRVSAGATPSRRCFCGRPPTEMTTPALTAAWTLCFEMVFDVAVTAVLLDRRLLSLCVGVFAAAMALRARGPIFAFLGNPIIFEFIFGVALSCLPRCRPAVWCLPIGAAALVAHGFIGIAPPIEINMKLYRWRRELSTHLSGLWRPGRDDHLQRDPDRRQTPARGPSLATRPTRSTSATYTDSTAAAVVDAPSGDP